MNEIDIWRTAGTLVKMYGLENAALTAAVAGFEVWKRVAQVISDLGKTSPADGEAVN